MAESNGIMATWQELDSGLVGANNVFWRTIAIQFSEGGGGFKADSDGVTFADFVHHEHPILDRHYEAINPANHGQFPAEKLRAVWKTIQSEYDVIMTKFTKSGNHNSSFTKQ